MKVLKKIGSVLWLIICCIWQIIAFIFLVSFISDLFSKKKR